MDNIEKIEKYLVKNFDQHEIFEERSNQRSISFESNNLKEVSSNQSQGFAARAIKDNQIWKKINNLKVPTLIIIPNSNPVFKLENHRKIVNNEFISIKRIDNSSHLFPIENPIQTSRLIIDFFKH